MVGLVSAFAFLISAVLGAVSTDATTNTIGLVGFVLWLAWILGVSYHLLVLAARPQEVFQSAAAPERLHQGRA